MKHVRAEIGQVGRFGVRELGQGARLGNDVGISGENAVHVAPDPHLIGVQPCADDGGGVIAASTPQGGGHTLLGGSDVAGDDRDHAPLDQRLDLLSQPPARLIHQRRRRAEVVVGDDQLGRTDRLGAHTPISQHGGQDVCRELFTK